MPRLLIPVVLLGLFAVSCTNECTEGAVDCACLVGDRCNAELVCVLGVCVEAGDVCGDGIVGRGEECDGSAVDNGACDSTCRLSCNLGYDDCNGISGDGCETDIRISLAHCGACSTPCDDTGGSASCGGGNCTVICNNGFDDCNNDTKDGCEVVLASDPTNCGVCGHDCLGGSCSGGRCLPMIFAADPNTQDIELDQDYVYFTSHGTAGAGYTDGAVVSMSKATGARTVLAPTQKAPTVLALDGSEVFWVRLGSEAAGYVDGAIFAVARTGGEVRTLVTGQEYPGGVAVDATHVYWTTSLSGKVGRIAKTGGVFPEWLAVSQSTPRAIVVDDTRVFWTDRYGTPSGSVMAADLDGTNQAPFAANQAGPYHLAQDTTTLFWVNWDTNTLMKAVKSTGSASAVVQEPGAITGIAVDDSTIYWGVDHDQGSSSVHARAKSGGDVIELVTGIDPPGALAADATAVYWTSAAGIMRLAK
jgi:sugar lactone lactonase YvrE